MLMREAAQIPPTRQIVATMIDSFSVQELVSPFFRPGSAVLECVHVPKSREPVLV